MVAARGSGAVLRHDNPSMTRRSGRNHPDWGGGGTAYAMGLAAASQARELLDPDGLGGYGWLVQAVGITDPLAAAPPYR